MDRCKISCRGAVDAAANSCNVPKEKCSLAMAYVPWQNWETMYNEEQALTQGTAFPSLDLPFCGRGPER